MRPRRVMYLVGVFALALTLGAKDFWEAPYEEWTRPQVVKLFNDSPWAQLQTNTVESMRGSRGQNEFHYAFTVRLLSARPMREAYYRMLQLMNNYDELPPERRKELDTRINWLLDDEQVKDQVVVSVAFKSDDPDGSRNVKRFLDTATTDTLNQSVYLFSSRGRDDLMKYVPAGQEGVGARFIFPRQLNGAPLLQPGDKELRFEFYVPPIGQKLMVWFKPSKMTYKGGLAY